jgi:hypothetical protein
VAKFFLHFAVGQLIPTCVEINPSAQQGSRSFLKKRTASFALAFLGQRVALNAGWYHSFEPISLRIDTQATPGKKEAVLF